MVRVAAVSTNRFGQCLRAACDVPVGTLVETFSGPVMPYADVPEAEVRHALLLDGDRWLVPESDARYINHACEPNCRIEPGSRVVTTQAVQAGEEFTINYHRVTAAEMREDPAAFFWDPRWSFDCACGSPACVGRVDGYRMDGE